MDFDAAWCFRCQREIAPKRYQVPVVAHDTPPPPPIPQPVAAPPPAARRTKSAHTAGTGRKQGLVHGTGRVRPNGTLKRVDSGKSNSSAPTTQQQQQPAAPARPVKLRTVIDQGPLPLYCSDDCRVADISESSNQIRDPYRRQSPVVPTTSSGDTTSRSSSLESRSSSPRPTTPPDNHVDPSLATLARYYHFKRPIPPPFLLDEPAQPHPNFDYPHNYDNGIIMAGRRIQELCPKPPKKKPYGPGNYAAPEPRKPIKGWDDGTSDWRAAVYSCGSTSRSADDVSKGCKNSVAFSHRSRSVVAGSSKAYARESAQPPSSYCAKTADLYAQFSASLQRRSDSRMTHVPSSSPDQVKERPLLSPDAEGMLLVPNVKMPVYTGSTTSLSAKSRRSKAEAQEPPQRPAVELRSWSYDNVRTYPVMQLPPQIEKRIVKEIIDGVEVERIEEYEVEQPRKKLFNFPPKEVPIRR